MKKSQGFTLIELLVVIGMLGILLVGFIAAFNPIAQYNKAQDAQREHDLGQIQRALDSYLNDTHCYPTSIPFGSAWTVGKTVYMEKVPQDPTCSINASLCYVYQTDGSSCPQWNILYASLRSASIPTNACPLALKNSCLPNGFGKNQYNYCTISGAIACSYISGTSIGSSGGTGGSGGGTGGSGGNGGGTPTITPKPTLEPSCPNGQYFGCTGIDNRCNSIAPQTKCTQFGGATDCYCNVHCYQRCTYN